MRADVSPGQADTPKVSVDPYLSDFKNYDYFSLSAPTPGSHMGTNIATGVDSGTPMAGSSDPADLASSSQPHGFGAIHDAFTGESASSLLDTGAQAANRSVRPETPDLLDDIEEYLLENW